MIKVFLSISIAFLFMQSCFAAERFCRAYYDGSRKMYNKRSVFVQAEFQFFKYNYFTVGFGYMPRNTMLSFARQSRKYGFNGWTFNYSKKPENSDWGTSVQTIGYSGTFNAPVSVGLEINYKSVSNKDHYSFKPLVGLSCPFVSLMYAYNFDFYKTKAERIKQHELILGLRFAVWRKLTVYKKKEKTES